MQNLVTETHPCPGTFLSKFCTIPISARWWFQILCIFTPTLNWKWYEMIQFDASYFSDGVEVETTSPLLRQYDPECGTVHCTFCAAELHHQGTAVTRRRCRPHPWWWEGKVTMFLLRNGGPPLCRGLKFANFRGFEVQFHKHRKDPWYIQIGEFPMPCCTLPPKQNQWEVQVSLDGDFGQARCSPGFWVRKSTPQNSSCLERSFVGAKSFQIYWNLLCFFWISATGLLKALWF